MKRLVALLALGTLALPAAWSQPALSEQEYRQTLRRYLREAQGGLTPAEARAWEDTLRRIQRVRRTDGTTLYPDHLGELASMRRVQDKAKGGERLTPSALAKARFGLRRWVLEESSTRLDPQADPLAQAKAIVAQPEYEKAHKKAQESAFSRWLRELQEKLAKWLRGLLPEAPNTQAPSVAGLATLVRVILYVLAGLAVAFGVVLLVKHGSGWRWNKKAKAQEAARTEDDLTGDGLVDPLGEAHAAAERGDFRLAVRLCYIACLRRLAERSLLTLERHRTNWEYQSQLRRRSPGAAARFLPATLLFDDLWYGERTAMAQHYTQLRQIFDTLPEAPE